MFFGFQYFFCDIDGAIFTLFEGSAHIFTDDTDAEQLNAAQQKNQNDDGCIAGDINAKEQFFADYPDQIQHRRHSRKAAAEHGKAQGSGGEADDAFNCIIEQLPEIPFRGAMGSFAGSVGNEFRFIANPCEDALGEAVILAKLQDALCHRAAEGAKIAGIGLERDFGQLVDDIIEAVFSPVEIGSVQVRKSGKRSVKLIGERCAVTINPDTGDLIQTNPL